MTKSKEWGSYRVTSTTRNNQNTYSGVAHIHNGATKKRKTRLNKKRFAAFIVTTTLSIYGGVSLVRDAKTSLDKGLSTLADNYIEYQESKKNIAFTNYYDNEIATMNYDEKLALYQDYLSFVEKDLAENRGRYFEINTARDISQALYYATSLDEIKDSIDPEEARKKAMDILNMYESIVEQINMTYNGKYLLNAHSRDDIIVINDVSKVTSPSSKLF